MNHWLMKSDAQGYSIDDLMAEPGKTDHWDGVRNYQARNFMRDDMRKGDLAFFYHSNCVDPGIVGIVEIVREAYPDHTAFDPGSPYFDPKSDPDEPRWFMVDVKFQRKLERIIALKEMKAHDLALGDFQLLRKGSRLSILPVAREQWDFILGLE